MATAITVVGLYLVYGFKDSLLVYLRHTRERESSPDTIVSIINSVGYFCLSRGSSPEVPLFGLIFRLKRGMKRRRLRNIFSIIAFTIFFFVIFSVLFPGVNLGALFTTSAIFGVILGLALQDTLGNFFAGISLHADRPFQVGDVVSIGQQRLTGVVEGISWRAIKIRTFQNHLVLLSNSSVAKEAIEVCPRNNLNARLVNFGTLYTDSPAKTIHVVREAVRGANVSRR